MTRFMIQSHQRKKTAYSEISRSAAREAACRSFQKGHYATFPPRGRTLHCLGGCYRVPTVDYTSFEYLGSSMPKSDKYDIRCNSCESKGFFPSRMSLKGGDMITVG